MTQVGNKSREKFLLLLKKFLEEDHQVIDDSCLEKLITHLSTEGEGPQLLELQESKTFCEKALQAYEKGIVSESLLSFALRLHGLVLSKEVYFNITEVQDATKCITMAPRISATTNASVLCAFVQMVTAMMAHKPGMDWLVKNDIWKTVFQLYKKSHSIYISRECQKYISQFVVTLDASKSELQSEILSQIINDIACEKNGNANLTPALDMITQILEVALKRGDSSIARLVESRLTKACNTLLDSNLDSTTLGRVAKVQALQFFVISEPTIEDLNDLERKIIGLLSRLMDEKNLIAVQALALQCQSFWCVLRPRVEDLQPTFHLHHQLLYVQVTFLLQPIVLKPKKDCVEDFLATLCRLTSEATQDLGCRLMELIKTSAEPELLACRASHSLMQMKDSMPRDTAVLVFKTFMCSIINFVAMSNMELIEAQSCGFLGTTLEAVIKMIDHFHFTWRESIETTCLLNMMHVLLREPNIGSRQASQVLQVIRRAIEGFMPPNLALLTNTLDGTHLDEIGPQLYRRLHDVSWEVRDSALEVLTVVAEISKDKFTAFQEHLLKHKLCSLAVAMATGDEESYVRASALKCLSAMVAVPKFWTESLNKESLSNNLTRIICHDSEGIVRMEAAALVSSLLRHQRLDRDERERMNIVMASAAVSDFHWEVKLNALAYWGANIDLLMTEQGMLDGRFPPVTFSKPSRKIVTLDNVEVQVRLKSVLAELARTRCLAVLLSGLHDPDLQVAREAADMLTLLQNLLREHGLIQQYQDMQTCEKVDSPISVESSGTNHDEPAPSPARHCSDKIIDSIIEQSDIALLASVCRAKLSLDEEANLSLSPSPAGVTLVCPEEFLQALSGLDITALVSARGTWLQNCSEHLDNLLSDMLEAKEFQHNTNDADCY